LIETKPGVGWLGVTVCCEGSTVQPRACPSSLIWEEEDASTEVEGSVGSGLEESGERSIGSCSERAASGAS
jgi:hypothetical protein